MQWASIHVIARQTTANYVGTGPTSLLFEMYGRTCGLSRPIRKVENGVVLRGNVYV